MDLSASAVQIEVEAKPSLVEKSLTDRVSELAPSNIIVVGGSAVVPDSVVRKIQSASPDATVTRLAGKDRYETGAAITNHVFKGAKSVDEVFVATGADYPDALSASAAAGGKKVPVILVDGTRNSLRAADTALLNRLKPKTVHIAGGTGVVSTGIEKQLDSKYAAQRLSGPDRYTTSAAINDAMFTEAPSMYWATGTDFADALSGAVLAGVRQAPLFVVQPTCVPTPTYEMITSKGTTRIGLIGGSGALDHRVANLLECTGPIRLSHPVPGSPWGDPFGPRKQIWINGKWTSSFHNGQDFPASTGTPIRAAHAGTVWWNAKDTKGGGNGIQIGAKNYSTLYMHMKELSKLKVGTKVKSRDVIGYVGSSGSATGPHLHFMLRINGDNTNPRPYIR